MQGAQPHDRSRHARLSKGRRTLERPPLGTTRFVAQLSRLSMEPSMSLISGRFGADEWLLTRQRRARRLDDA